MTRSRQDEEKAIQKLKRSQAAISQIQLIMHKEKWEDDTLKSVAAYLCQDVAHGIEAGISTLSAINNMTHSENFDRKKAKLDDYHRHKMKTPISGRTLTTTPYADGYRWKKYGRKNIKNAEYPRSYYRCAHDACPAAKQVQRNDSEDPPNFLVMYHYNHTCTTFIPQTLSSSKAADASPSSPPAFDQNARHSDVEIQQHQQNFPGSSKTLIASDVKMPENDNWGSVFTNCPSPEYPWGWNFGP